jgi:general stress protein 26
MTTDREIEAKFWKALKSDATILLGLVGVDGGRSQPMTAQLDGEQGPIWFFAARSSDLVRAMGPRHEAVAHFAAKGHQVFASLHGELVLDNDRATIDRLWNRFVAAWFEGGKDDPELALLRFEPDDAQAWLNEKSLLAGIKLLLGRDPKREYADKVADLDLQPA